MDMFTQKCNQLEARISSPEEKQNYKQTHSRDYFLIKKVFVKH